MFHTVNMIVIVKLVLNESRSGGITVTLALLFRFYSLMGLVVGKMV